MNKINDYDGGFIKRLLQAGQFKPLSLQAPNAWCGHLPFAAWLVRELQPDTFVELGTHTGNSFFSFCQAIKESGLPTRAYAIDTWQGDEHAGYYGDAVFQQVHEHNEARYAGFARLLRLTFDEGLDYFADSSIDLLHIDGLHTYDAVKHDFDSWLPKLRPGAVVLFHDTNVRERSFGVWKLWEELSSRYPSLEFMHSNGLGVLQIDGGPPEKRLAWLQADDTEKQTLRDYFAALGDGVLEAFAVKQLKQRGLELMQAHEQLQHIHDADHQAAVTAAELAAEREAKLEERLVEQHAFIEEVLTSNSWRVTAPLRFVVGLFKPNGKKKH